MRTHQNLPQNPSECTRNHQNPPGHTRTQNPLEPARTHQNAPGPTRNN
jgi:hypothetical protein